MKKKIAIGLSVLILSSSALTSCKAVQNSNKTQRGAVIGAAGGAVLGAVLGGVVGGVAGGLIGRKMDKQAREIQEQLPGAQVERVGEGIKLVLGENAVRFDFNKSTLTSTAKALPLPGRDVGAGLVQAPTKNRLIKFPIDKLPILVNPKFPIDPIGPIEKIIR